MIDRLLLGFITNFFDTLGIGSFAPTTAAFRARRLMSDELIPGTLNVGHTPPTIVQAIIYITAIAVGTGRPSRSSSAPPSWAPGSAQAS